MAPTSTAQRGQRSRANSKRDIDTPTIAVTNAPNETPIRSSKRRRRTIDESAQPEDTQSVETTMARESTGTEEPDGDQLVALVSTHLSLPADSPVQASRDHANQLHESKDGVKAYAKIAAQDWTFYVTKLEINIGRTSDPVLAAAAIAADPSLADAEDAVHIDLGPSKTVSRQHAMIYFDSDGEEWNLKAKGRNGLKLDGMSMKYGTCRALRSGNVIEIGGIEMMFVLPTEISPLHISDVYLARAGLPTKNTSVSRPMTANSISTMATPARIPHSEPANLETPLPRSSSVTTVRPVSRDLPAPIHHPVSAFQQPIAPAPPDYHRPGTPGSARQNITATPRAGINSTPLGGPHPDIDLSLDENSHIKPQYSYAQMITQAILNTPEEKLNLNGIYTYITDHYAYYRRQPSAGWQNSIRHNLSLNRAFDKVARATDEPGKGMKWQLVADSREEMIRNAYRGGRGGHRGSSVPSSPNQLNYINQGPRDMAASTRKRRLSPIHSSPGNADVHNTPIAATPDRSVRRKGPLSSGVAVDGSPLPRPRTNRKPVPSSATTNYQMPTLQPTSSQPTIVADTPQKPSSSQQTLAPPRSPLLSSTAYSQEAGVFATPAPPRVHPRLNPPSTLQRPSKLMPTSSPALFWKYVDIGSTPMRGMLNVDSSPSRPSVMDLAGSSPPRLDNSPSARGASRNAARESKKEEMVSSAQANGTADEEESGEHGVVAASQSVADVVGSPSPVEEVTFDLTKGFQSIGAYHASSQGLGPSL